MELPGGSALPPPYTNESQAIRYPPMPGVPPVPNPAIAALRQNY